MKDRQERQSHRLPAGAENRRSAFAILAILALPFACSDTSLTVHPDEKFLSEARTSVESQLGLASESSVPEHFRMAMEAVRILQETALEARLLGPGIGPSPEANVLTRDLELSDSRADYLSAELQSLLNRIQNARMLMEQARAAREEWLKAGGRPTVQGSYGAETFGGVNITVDRACSESDLPGDLLVVLAEDGGEGGGDGCAWAIVDLVWHVALVAAEAGVTALTCAIGGPVACGLGLTLLVGAIQSLGDAISDVVHACGGEEEADTSEACDALLEVEPDPATDPEKIDAFFAAVEEVCEEAGGGGGIH